MHWIEQSDKRNCGQIAVAMLTNRPLDEVTNLVGHSHGTKTKELCKALRALGYKPERERCTSRAPTFGLAQVKSAASGWHWIALGEGYIWDGSGTGPLSLAEYKTRCEACGWRITSYLPVMEAADAE